MGKGAGSKCQSTRLCLFVGFPTLSVDFEHLKFLVLAASRAGTIQAIRGCFKKDRNGDGICRKKRKKKLVVRRDIGCNGLWVRVLGVWLSIIRNRR